MSHQKACNQEGLSWRARISQMWQLAVYAWKLTDRNPFRPVLAVLYEYKQNLPYAHGDQHKLVCLCVAVLHQREHGLPLVCAAGRAHAVWRGNEAPDLLPWRGRVLPFCRREIQQHQSIRVKVACCVHLLSVSGVHLSFHVTVSFMGFFRSRKWRVSVSLNRACRGQPWPLVVWHACLACHS